MNYLSPYVILYGASQGIINGSMIVFGILFLASLFFGRLWCAWICPAGGLGEISMQVNDKPVRRKWLNGVRWMIWVLWLGTIAWFAYSAGGFKSVNFFLLTESGISMDEPAKYIIYFIVVGIFLSLSFGVGRRAGCHTICWMAPFMILGRKIRNLFAWPAFRFQAEKEKCIQCSKCTQVCSMSLDVEGMVLDNRMENSEWILCAQCVDNCPKDVIHLTFQPGR